MSGKGRLPRTNDPRERDGWRRHQDDDNSLKANKIVGGVEDNVVTLADDGDIKDSGVGIDDISLKVIDGTEDNILILDSDGDMKDGGMSIDEVDSSAFFFARNY